MQPTTRPINPSKKVLVTMRFVFVIGGPMKLIRPSIADMMTPPEPFCRCGAPLIQTKLRASRPIMPGRGTHACTMDAPIRLSVDVTTGDVELIRVAYSSR